ncbi:MAG: 23S rRNA (uracil(1939)-C(5))-methyltransferase RlmD [Vicinamibacterales bacterium]
MAAPADLPRCRHFGRCGGCQWQHVPYAGQLERKRASLDRLFRGYATPAPVIPMPGDASGMPWHFRHKSAFVFSPAGRSFVMGHFAAGGREVIPVEECPVQSARANRIAFRLRDELLAARVTAAGPDLTGVLRHLIVRTSADDTNAVAMLVVTRNAAELKRPVRALLASSDRPDGFFLNVHDTPSPYMVGRRTLRIDGRALVPERVGGCAFLVSPTAFFQTNPTAADILVELVLAALDEGEGDVLDLYSGSGLFTLPLAMRGHRVTAIEENPSAVADARRNLDVNRISPRRVRLLTGRVERELWSLPGRRFDAVVLDPPRQGCAPAVLREVFGRLAPARAVYVSCGPEALARELESIVAAGYRVSALQPVDMFPHTAHVEVVAVLDRHQPPSGDARMNRHRRTSRR